jgi:hypothetical protein
VAERGEAMQELWIKDFLATWINRFSFFLAHHPTKPVLLFTMAGAAISVQIA